MFVYCFTDSSGFSRGCISTVQHFRWLFKYVPSLSSSPSINLPLNHSPFSEGFSHNLPDSCDLSDSNMWLNGIVPSVNDIVSEGREQREWYNWMQVEIYAPANAGMLYNFTVSSLTTSYQNMSVQVYTSLFILYSTLTICCRI